MVPWSTPGEKLGFYFPGCAVLINVVAASPLDHHLSEEIENKKRMQGNSLRLSRHSVKDRKPTVRRESELREADQIIAVANPSGDIAVLASAGLIEYLRKTHKQRENRLDDGAAFFFFDRLCGRLIGAVAVSTVASRRELDVMVA